MKYFLFLLSFFLGACAGKAEAEPEPQGVPDTAQSLVVAGGCFWCVESDFEKVDGVYEAISGYSGGENRNATYRDHEGHREVVEIYYDPSVTNYADLVHKFLRTIDVTDAGGQFCDRGFAYTTAVHYRTEDERVAAEAALAEAATELGQDIATVAVEHTFFVEAEDYHQNYYSKNPIRYRLYRNNCGRDRRVEDLWGQSAH